MSAGPATPLRTLAVGNRLGEGILWDARHGALWWTDIQGCRLHRYDWATEALQVYELPERLASFGLVHGSDRLVAAFASGIALFEPASGRREWVARPEEIRPGIRFNDGRVDRRGRFWVGTMVEDERLGAAARLYCLGPGGRLAPRLDGVRISNGLCTSPDGARLYFADSPTGSLRRFALREPEGELGEAETFAQAAPGGSPDGATVDAQGGLWSAEWGAGRILRYRPDGSVDRVLPVPASLPSCVCFAGPDLDVLCVTSAREGLGPQELAREPQAGHVFFYRPGVIGLAEETYLP